MFWLCWVLIAVHRLSLVEKVVGATLVAVLICTLHISHPYPVFTSFAYIPRASHCGGFYYCGAQPLGHTGFSSCSTWAQQLWLVGSKHRRRCCGAWSQLLCGMWDLPGPGIEPVFPALQGGFLTTVHQKSPEKLFFELLSLPLNLDSNFSDTGEDGKHKIKMTVR